MANPNKPRKFNFDLETTQRFIKPLGYHTLENIPDLDKSLESFSSRRPTCYEIEKSLGPN